MGDLTEAIRALRGLRPAGADTLIARADAALYDAKNGADEYPGRPLLAIPSPSAKLPGVHFSA